MRKVTDAGIDVSKPVLHIAVRRDERRFETARFDNDAAGHKRLLRWLTKGGRTARVVLESTGTYSLDVALALQRTPGIVVMVANPRAIKQFAGALMQRSKTDLTAAVALRDFVIRMPFVAWQPPATHLLELRSIARRIAALVVERTRERNRLHALRATAEASAVVDNDIEVNVRHLERRIALLSAQAVALLDMTYNPVVNQRKITVNRTSGRTTSMKPQRRKMGNATILTRLAIRCPGCGRPAWA
jgi:transposase